MKISRREVVVGATGVALVAATPALATPAVEPVSRSALMLNVQRTLDSFKPPLGEPLKKLILTLNERLLEDHGEELFGDRFMVGPVGETESGAILTAKTRAYAARWEFESAQDAIALGGEVAEAAIIKKLVDEIADEFRSEISFNPGLKVYPYVPILSAGVVLDPRTLTPIMSFMTRYDAV